MRPGIAMMCSGRGGVRDPHWANVRSLLHFDGADASTTFTDSRGILTWTRTGALNCEIDTAQSVFGGASMACATNGIRSSSSAANNIGTGDFIAEGRIRLSTLSGTQIFFDSRASGPAVAPALYTVSGQVRMYANGADRIIGAALAVNTWYAFSLERVSGVTTLRINGVQSGSAYADANDYVTNTFTWGDANYTAGSGITGWLDECRITLASRYGTDYTPSATAFPNS